MHQQIKRLVTLFGVPHRPDPEAFLQEFDDAVCGWPDDIVRKAVDRIRNESVDGFWPMPGAFVKLLHECRPKPPRRIEVTAHEPELTPEQRERMHEMWASLKDAVEHMQTDSKPAVDWPRTQHPAFEKMMRDSPNKHLYRTDRSRSMTGDTE